MATTGITSPNLDKTFALLFSSSRKKSAAISETARKTVGNSQDYVFETTGSDQLIITTTSRPTGSKGALIAAPVDGDLSTADILFFSRFPTEENVTLTANIASEDIPGRSYPVFQDMGAQGVDHKLQLWFYYAFIDGSTQLKAHTCEIWSYRYVIKDDGTGRATAPAALYYQRADQLPVRIVIKSIELHNEFFDALGNPQQVEATVDFSLYVPQNLVIPFKPKVPKITRRYRRKRKVKCPTGASARVGLYQRPSDVGSSEYAKAGASLFREIGAGIIATPSPVTSSIRSVQQFFLGD